ncbi:recombinase family protein [Polycladomyces sp. WAk]|uniref:Recombinase family protein n=1 Tax=Polycladomyces zharkentensis TaxID=2807616 RepID=A0ABS2WI20_9BACL|nr:recombinase family protein [Polycladomyces sp. WAk]MBN2909174.1 recombinase family protein [Polycladomyces sp. WAk]
MSAKYAVYVRVSTDKDEQVSSVENQIDICRNWLERNGYEWNEQNVYKDEGISGTVFLDRPAIQLLLEKAKRREIDMVVFKSISRLARDLKDSLEIREVLISHNVRIISVEEGYDSHKAGKNDMAFELWSLFSAQYSRTLSAGTAAALAAKVRRGEHIGRIPYGYRREDGFLVIDEEEAKVVRQIYDWYNSGWGYKRITNELNARGIKPKVKSKWQVTSVQRLIQNPIYCGDFILNQYTTVKVGGRRKQIRNPREKWIYFKNHHPAIISREEWRKANKSQEEALRRKITPWNEFRGLAKCSECGSNMVINSTSRKRRDGNRYWNYMKCSRYRRGGGCVNHDPILYEDFRALILKQLMEKGRSVSLNFTSDFEIRKEAELQQLMKTREQAENRKKNLVDLYLDQLISKQEFEERRREIEEQIQSLEDQIFLLRKREYTENNIQTIQEAFQLLEDQDQDLYKAFQVLIEEIQVHPDGTIDIAYTFEKPVS